MVVSLSLGRRRSLHQKAGIYVGKSMAKMQNLGSPTWETVPRRNARTRLSLFSGGCLMARKRPKHGTGTRDIKWHGPLRVGEVVILENDDTGSTFAVTYEEILRTIFERRKLRAEYVVETINAKRYSVDESWFGRTSARRGRRSWASGT